MNGAYSTKQSAKSKDDDKPQNIERGLKLISDGIGPILISPQFNALPAAKQSLYTNVAIAMTIANRVLDVTTDEQYSLFYKSSQETLLKQIVSEVNEKFIVDINMQFELVPMLWTIRQHMIAGEIAPWNYYAKYKALLRPELASVALEVIEFMGGMEK